MANFRERKRWLLLLVLPVLFVTIYSGFLLPVPAHAKAPHIEKDWGATGGEGDPTDWTSPRRGGGFYLTVFWRATPTHWDPIISFTAAIIQWWT
jgi:hypothetical protein